MQGKLLSRFEIPKIITEKNLRDNSTDSLFTSVRKSYKTKSTPQPATKHIFFVGKFFKWVATANDNVVYHGNFDCQDSTYKLPYFKSPSISTNVTK